MLSQDVHVPRLDTVQPARYSSLLQIDDFTVRQLRLEHALLVQLVQPTPNATVDAHTSHVPALEAEQPDR